MPAWFVPRIGDQLGVGVEGVELGVGDVPGIQAETHPFGVGVGEEAADLLAGLDVALGARVKHEPQAGLVAHDPAKVPGALDQRAPVVRVEVGRGRTGPNGQ